MAMAMNEQIRVGVIGTSWFSDLLHLPALKSHPGTRIAAVCGRNPVRAQEMADKYGAEQVFTDYRAMLDKGQLQAVVIVVPDDLHYPMTMDALDARLHVYCEKPLAMNADQAKKMLAKAQAAGVKHMVGFGWRNMPHFRYTRQLVDEGYIGRSYYAEFRFAAGYARAAEYGWRFDPQRGTGILGDLGSHMIDLARLLLGDITAVQARLTTQVDKPGTDGKPMDTANDSAQLLVEFGSGARGVIVANAIAHTGNRLQEQHAILYGSQGTLEVDYNFAEGHTMRGIRDGADAFQTLAVPEHILSGIDPQSPPFAQYMRMITEQSVYTRAFIDCIVDNRPASPDFADGASVQAVIDAAFESNRQGCRVAIAA
jgi:UDP-N-acetylglucosamine 3-dehydrogenase